MSVAQDLLLIALDPATHKVRLPSMQSDAVLGGAALIDLVLLSRLQLEGEGRKARVVVADQTPVDDPDLQPQFDRVRSRGRQTPKSVVTRLGKKYRPAVLATLASTGALRDDERSILGARLERYELVDVARRDGLLDDLRQVLLHQQPPDERTGPLVGLLAAADLLKLVVERRDLKTAKARAKVVAEGDWASEGVRKAIQDAQAAMTTAITVGVVAGASGS